jgi:hypothetical protein
MDIHVSYCYNICDKNDSCNAALQKLAMISDCPFVIRLIRDRLTSLTDSLSNVPLPMRKKFLNFFICVPRA